MIDDNDSLPQIRDIAVIKLASYKVDTAPADEVRALLQPLMQENSSWKNLAKEIAASLALKEKNEAEAQRLFNEIIADPQASEAARSRAKDILSVLDNAA